MKRAIAGLVVLGLGALFACAALRERDAGRTLAPTVPGRFVDVSRHRVHVAERGAAASAQGRIAVTTALVRCTCSVSFTINGSKPVASPPLATSRRSSAFTRSSASGRAVAL